MHLTFAGILTAIIAGGFVAFLAVRYRRHQRISRQGWVGLIVLLLICGASISQSQYLFLDEPLVMAAQQGDLDIVKDCLAKGASANAYGDDGMGTALVAASAADRTDIVTLLLQNGADANQPSEGQTPLSAARGYPEIVKLLRQAGARN